MFQTHTSSHLGPAPCHTHTHTHTQFTRTCSLCSAARHVRTFTARAFGLLHEIWMQQKKTTALGSPHRILQLSSSGAIDAGYWTTLVCMHGRRSLTKSAWIFQIIISTSLALQSLSDRWCAHDQYEHGPSSSSGDQLLRDVLVADGDQELCAHCDDKGCRADVVTVMQLWVSEPIILFCSACSDSPRVGSDVLSTTPTARRA